VSVVFVPNTGHQIGTCILAMFSKVLIVKDRKTLSDAWFG